VAGATEKKRRGKVIELWMKRLTNGVGRKDGKVGRRQLEKSALPDATAEGVD